MKQNLLLMFLFAFVLCGCEDNSAVTETSKITLQEDCSSFDFSHNKESASILFTTNAKWTAQISDTTYSDVSWLKFSPAEGESGDNEIVITANANTTSQSRSTTLKISCRNKSEEIYISQAGYNATLALSRYFEKLPYTEGKFYIDVESNSAWKFLNAPEWATFTPSAGSQNMEVAVSYQANTSTEARQHTVEIASLYDTLTFDLYQAAYLANTPIALSTNEEVVAADSGSFTLDISSATAWSANSIEEWLELSANSGDNSDSVVVHYLNNTSTEERIDTIIFQNDSSQSELVVKQSPFVPILSLNKSNITVTYPEGKTTMSVTANSKWKIINSPSWVTFSASSGSSYANIAVSYSQNASTSPRSGIITIESDYEKVSCYITQGACDTYLTINTSKANLNNSSGSFNVVVSSNTTWTITSVPSWMSITPLSGSGNETITIKYDSNSYNYSRSATIIFGSTSATSKYLAIEQSAAEETALEAMEPSAAIYDWTKSSKTDFSLGDNLAITAYNYYTGAEVAVSAPYSYNGTKFTSTEPITFDPTTTTRYKCYATYPYVSGGTEFEFSVNNDQSTSENYKNSDLLQAYYIASTTTPTFNFYHRLAKLEIKLSSSEVNLTGAEVTIYAKTTTKCNIYNNTYTATADVEAITSFSMGNNTFAAILAPQTINSSELMVKVVVNGKTYNVVAQNNVVLTSGTQSSYTLEIKNDTLSFGGQINPWEPEN